VGESAHQGGIQKIRPRYASFSLSQTPAETSEWFIQNFLSELFAGGVNWTPPGTKRLITFDPVDAASTVSPAFIIYEILSQCEVCFEYFVKTSFTVRGILILLYEA